LHFIIREHSYYGHESLSKIKALSFIAELVLYHHERVDGKGYPYQKSQNDIPVGSRMLCVADAYDAMVNNRPYHTSISNEKACRELRRCSGTQKFDKKIVEIFINEVAIIL
jgi:HD-GYP domain-containing protein (c-di-GMP phosphodiesterase class II)